MQNITKDEKELVNRTIPGITWKQVVGYTGIIALGIGAYFNMMAKVDNGREQSQQNNELLKEIRVERKEDKLIEEARLKVIEAQIQEINLRITIMEKFVEGYNKIK